MIGLTITGANQLLLGRQIKPNLSRTEPAIVTVHFYLSYFSTHSGSGQVEGVPKATTTSAFHRVTGSGGGPSNSDKQITSKDINFANTNIQRVSNSPLLPQPTHSSLPSETKKPNTLGEMATVSTNQNSRLPVGTISPTHSGELPTEDEVDSPTPSSTASEPITDQFLPSPKTNQRSTNRNNDTLHMKSPRLKNLTTEDGRTTDEEDLEGVRDDAFTWPTHSSYDEQR